MSRVVIKMVFAKNNTERVQRAKDNLSKLDLTMYLPQVIMLSLAFVLGLYMPKFLQPIIEIAIAG